MTGPGHERFVDHDGTYLLSHSVGLALRGTRGAAGAFIDAWESDPVDVWDVWLATIDRFRGSVAALIGGDAAAICPQTNVSSGLVKLLGSLPWRSAAPTILMSERAFPSMGFAASGAGLEPRFVPGAADVTDPEVWADHLANVDAVLVTHAHSNTGALSPVAEIASVARERGVISIVDVAQTSGIVPIDVAAWRADVIIGSCVKWLSGGPGAGWMWVDREVLAQSEPRDVGWFSHADPFEFDIHRFRYADDALRFWGGTPSVLPFAVAQHAIDEIAAIGVPDIRAWNQRRIDQLIDRLGERIVSPHDRERRGGTCIVDADESVDARLALERVGVDRRDTGLRVSPHVHTSADDVDRFAELIVGA